MDFGSFTEIFCSFAFFPNGNVLLEEKLPASLRYRVNGRDEVDVSRRTCSIAEYVHERTMLSKSFSGNSVPRSLALHHPLAYMRSCMGV